MFSVKGNSQGGLCGVQRKQEQQSIFASRKSEKASTLSGEDLCQVKWDNDFQFEDSYIVQALENWIVYGNFVDQRWGPGIESGMSLFKHQMFLGTYREPHGGF